MVASEFIDDIARGSGLWDVVNLTDTDVDQSARAPSVNHDRPSVKKRSPTSSIFIEDALMNS